MRRAVVTTARALFAAGATGMLGIAMLAAPPAARASQGGCSSSSPCSLAFMAQPAGTTVGTSISSGFDSPSAGPVKVKVVDQLGATVTNSKAAITIAITSTANPGGGTLAGTNTVKAVGGVASFSGLSINQPGVGYRLTAAASGMGSATSDHFDIWTSIQQCSPPAFCSASESSAAMSGTVTTSSADNTTRFVGTGISSGNTYSCAGNYQPVSDQFSFDVVDGSGGMEQHGQFTVALRIFKKKVQESGHPGASTWQICYAAAQQLPMPSWATGTATIGDVTYDTGLLPDCGNTPTPPCVQSRTKDNAGDVIVTFLASGDPIGKG